MVGHSPKQCALTKKFSKDEFFDIMKTSHNSVITDFKCIICIKNKSLRWDYSYIMKEDNNYVSFFEAVRHKGIIELDIVLFINLIFIEIYIRSL
jgi:hypothetical protein